MKYVNIFLIGILLLLCTSLVSSLDETSVRILETEPSDELKYKIDKIFSKSSTLSVKYSPYGGSIPLNEKLIEKRWRYNFSYRCGSLGCSNYAFNVQKLLLSGLKQNSKCPKPITALITFSDLEKEIAKIYLHHSGQCFILDNESYFLKESFNKFFDTKKLYPDFAKSYDAQ